VNLLADFTLRGDDQQGRIMQCNFREVLDQQSRLNRELEVVTEIEMRTHSGVKSRSGRFSPDIYECEFTIMNNLFDPNLFL
jgi:hypothetical protein